jgi:hypothetical protein
MTSDSKLTPTDSGGLPTRRGPLKATGYEGDTLVNVQIPVGPFKPVDAEAMDLMRESIAILYAGVGAARTLKRSGDKEAIAFRDIIVSSAAIGATEADAFFLLASFGMLMPSHIHARSLGQIATRCRVLWKRKDLALQMAESLEASRKEVVNKVPDAHPVRRLMARLYEAVTGKTMETIERAAYTKAEKSQSFAQDALEVKVMSKWNHADITALADAGCRLLGAGANVQIALNYDPTFERTFHRAFSHVVSIIVALTPYVPELKAKLIDFGERWERFTNKLQEGVGRDRELLARLHESLNADRGPQG